MQKRLSIKAIAKDLNISPTTISFVLNNKALDKRISPALINRVKEHIEKIGYQPNQIAQSLRTGKSRMVVFMVEDISDPIFAAMAKVIEQRLFQEGYTTIYCSTDNGIDKTRRLVRQFNDLSIDGYIIAPPKDFDTCELQQLIANDKSVVFFEPQNINPAYSQEALANELTQAMLKSLINPKQPEVDELEPIPFLQNKDSRSIFVAGR